MSQWLCVFVVLAISHSGVYGQGLTDAEEAEILRAHNHFRGIVDPIATNMLKLEWNDNLAYLAQYSAGTCEYRQEENRNSQSAAGFDYVGRNVASTSSYTVNFTQMIAQQWYGEKRFFNYYSAACLDEDGNINENGEFETCGRYTQMVWARTYALGCGAYRCQELEGAEDNNENAVFLVCYYGPGGNFAYEPPYSTGSKPCENCPYNRKYCTKNLCSESGAPTVGPLSLLGMLVMVAGVVRSTTVL